MSERIEQPSQTSKSTVDESSKESHAPPDSVTKRRALTRRQGSIIKRLSFDEIGVLLALLILSAIIGIFHPDFLTSGSLVGVVRQAAFVAIMAFGIVFLLSMREIDLSIGSMYGVTIIGAAILMNGGLNPWLASFVGILIGAVLGAVNGLLTSGLKVPTIVVTLGTLSAYRGIVFVWSNAKSITNIPSQNAFFTIFGGDYIGVPVSVWVLIALAIILTVLYRQTRFGVMVRAIGSNEQAARFSGIPIARIRFLTLTLMGILCGVAGMLTLAYFGAADPTLGQGLELQVIAAAIIGGTSLAGGSGTILGALLGALIIEIINSGIVYFNVPTNWESFVTGGVIILAVAADGVLRRRRLAQPTAGSRNLEQ